MRRLPTVFCNGCSILHFHRQWAILHLELFLAFYSPCALAFLCFSFASETYVSICLICFLCFCSQNQTAFVCLEPVYLYFLDTPSYNFPTSLESFKTSYLTTIQIMNWKLMNFPNMIDSFHFHPIIKATFLTENICRNIQFLNNFYNKKVSITHFIQHWFSNFVSCRYWEHYLNDFFFLEWVKEPSSYRRLISCTSFIKGYC